MAGPAAPDGSPDELVRLRRFARGGAAALSTGCQWEAFLRRAARTAAFGFTNVMLIWAQRPDAVELRDYQGWQRAGRQVIRGERGVSVIIPARPGRGDGPGRPERAGTVFDVAQTRGRNGDPAMVHVNVWKAVAALALREGVHVLGPGTASAADIEEWFRWAAQARGEAEATTAAMSVVRKIAWRLAGAHGTAGILIGPRTRRVVRDSIGYLIALRLGLDTSGFTFPSVSSWAGIDERSHRTETVVAAGELIVAAARKAFRCIDAHRVVAEPRVSAARLASRDQVAVENPAAGARAEPELATAAELAEVLNAAAKIFSAALEASWVPGYLAGRGFGSAVLERWRIGYAPASWTTLSRHLREAGYGEAVIQASGLATRSGRGELIDAFRDRAMFPVRLADGRIAGFIGRAAEGASRDVPKYINSRQTSLYRKGAVLFGLHEGRATLVSARPVIVEGPLDAIAVTEAGAGKYVGVAPCGTALTGDQVELLSREADLRGRGVVVAFDGDKAGLGAAVRAYDLLHGRSAYLAAAAMPVGQDPADIVRGQGAVGLVRVLDEAAPLADLAIDATVAKFEPWLTFVEGKFNALAAVAPRIARLPAEQVARQVARVATLLDLTHAEVTAAVTDAVTSAARQEDSRQTVISWRADRRQQEREARTARAAARRAGLLDARGNAAVSACGRRGSSRRPIRRLR